MISYNDIFKQRGHLYDQAMKKYSYARDHEFTQLFTYVDFTNIINIADIPSGGSYLTRFLPSNCQIDAIEPCDSLSHTPSQHSNHLLENISLPTHHYDLVVCLAAIHHISNKQLFIGSLYNALKNNGYLCIADVAHNNTINVFLDEFAGRHNGTGHSGEYIDSSTITGIIEPLGGVILSNKEIPCPWVFSDEESMLDFCKLLFGLKNISDEELLQALNHYVGISYNESTVQLQWQLLYATIKKPL
jgi:SAM-dependent methyltransferase